MVENSDETIILITGASRGLGYAIGRAVARPGAHVLAVARTVGGLEELDEEIQARGGSATLVPLDITDDPGLERLGAAIFERWGRIDTWFHAAAHPAPLSPVDHVDVKDLDRSFAVNARATQRLIRVLDPLLRQAPAGRAVFFDDPGAARPFHSAYCTSKMAQIEFAQIWAREIARTTKIHVTIASPPPMASAVRARFYPGENGDALTDPTTVADALLAEIETEPGSYIDLRAITGVRRTT